MIERIARYRQVSGEVGNLERTKDGTNKIETYLKGLTRAKVIPHLPGGTTPTTIADEIKLPNL